MPKIIKANEMNINGIDNINLNINSKKTEDDTEKQQLNSGNVDTILNISRTAKLMEENNNRANNTIKKAGETAKREIFEDNVSSDAKIKNRLEYISAELFQRFIIERPDDYAQWLEYHAKAYEYDLDSKEHRYWMQKATLLDWKFVEDVTINGNKEGRFNEKISTLGDLEKKYSDEIHDTSFNVCTSSKHDLRSNIWSIGTKFNVLLSTDLFNTLLESKSKKSEDLYTLIDDCVGNMKRIEKEYEGNKEMLIFGARIEDDGKPTYYANYKGCENPEGVSAKDADELLKKINE